MKKFWMISMLLIAALFVISCGDGGDEDTTNIAGSSCETEGAFNCENNIVLKCESSEWQKIKQCTDNQKCNATKGICETTGGNGENGSEGGNGEGGNSEGGNGSGNNGGGNNTPCTPQCDGKECGSDGCGGVCGTCGSNQGCNAEFKCEELKVDEMECTGLSINWNDFTFSPNVYSWYVDKNDTELSFMFKNKEGTKRTPPVVGERELGTGDNATFKTCTDCIIYITDIKVDSEGNQSYTLYFPNSGSLKIDSYNEDSNEIKGSISAKFLEATIADDGTTTFKSGGKCFEIESGSFECTAQCGEKQCGGNGCGGQCGNGCLATDEGEESFACSSEGKCVDYKCDTLSFDSQYVSLEENKNTGQIFYDALTNEAGSASLYDLLFVYFYGFDEEKDSYYYPTDFADVAAIAMEFYEDVYNPSTKSYTDDYKTFINTTLEEGDEEIDYTPGTMKSKGSLSFRLEEVDSRYIQVPGGKCYDVDNFTWDLK